MLLVDVAALTFMDSSGLDELLRLRIEAARQNGEWLMEYVLSGDPVRTSVAST
ncbi:hypothetical protein [Kitasatospora sp. NPDC094015]|uniref:hypothetical protein n=1 Tax=Kitasatospora sp. NPDC094015 TaxID=3155205 RepID=UPI003322DC6A